MSVDYFELCRLCLGKESVAVSIFEGEGDTRQIFLKITACLSVKVTPEDRLPKKICRDCVEKVEQYYDYWLTTSHAEKQFKEWLGDDNLEYKQEYQAIIQPVTDPNTQKDSQKEMDETSDDDENSDDDYNNDAIQSSNYDALPCSEIDPSVHQQQELAANSSIQPPTFVNVLPSDGASTSALQQQKLDDIPEMMNQMPEEDSKSGEGETFGGLSGMLRQILSPSPETSDGIYSGCYSMIQPGIFTNYPMLSPSIQHVLPTSPPYHHTSHATSLISLEQAGSPIEHLEIHVDSHQCHNCGLNFRSLPKLNYHIRMCHQMNTNDNHRRHEENEFSQNQVLKYSCTICGRMFQTLSHLRMHEVSHSSQQQIQPIQQQVQQNIQIMSSETNDQTFGCDRCQASFRYRTLLERHKKMHMVGQDKPYVCPRCPMRFETRTLYNHHAKTHKPIINNTTLSTSQNIGNQTSNINNLNLTTTGNQNMDKPPSETPVSYPCDSCTKQFLTIESLTSHKAVHRSRPLVCDVCGKGFTHRKYYVVHQRIHTGERPYLCAMCGKSFTQASTLTVHRRYHTGERPYTCTLCGKGFVTRTIMLNHMKKH